mgnify:CR=1 FL=1
MLCDSKKLTAFVRDIIMTAGLGEEDAAVFADSLVFADMRGVASHGVTRGKRKGNKRRYIIIGK